MDLIKIKKITYVKDIFALFKELIIKSFKKGIIHGIWLGISQMEWLEECLK